MQQDTQKLEPTRQIIVKRYEASVGFIVVILLLVMAIMMSCFLVVQLSYAALESAENVLGYRTNTPSLQIPAPPLPTEVPSIEIIPLPTALSPAATVTITGTGVITP